MGIPASLRDYLEKRFQCASSDIEPGKNNEDFMHYFAEEAKRQKEYKDARLFAEVSMDIGMRKLDGRYEEFYLHTPHPIHTVLKATIEVYSAEGFRMQSRLDETSEPKVGFAFLADKEGKNGVDIWIWKKPSKVKVWTSHRDIS